MLTDHFCRRLAKLIVLSPMVLAFACSGASPESTSQTGSVPEAATSTAQVQTTVRPPTISVPPTPEPTPILVADLPIIDLHFHPDPAWGSSLGELLDRLGVRMAGSGAS